MCSGINQSLEEGLGWVAPFKCLEYYICGVSPTTSDIVAIPYIESVFGFELGLSVNVRIQQHAAATSSPFIALI